MSKKRSRNFIQDKVPKNLGLTFNSKGRITKYKIKRKVIKRWKASINKVHRINKVRLDKFTCGRC